MTFWRLTFGRTRSKAVPEWPQPARYVRITATQLSQPKDSKAFLFALGEVKAVENALQPFAGESGADVVSREAGAERE